MASELFDFADPTSFVSVEYRSALNIALTAGVKVLFIGSLDDQLVPLHVSSRRKAMTLLTSKSSIFADVDHPHVYRAVFVDGRIHVADFLTHLVGLAMKFRNLRISDHGLIRELSNPLAGSLVGGEGHSRIYEDLAVYDLAIEVALKLPTSKSDAKYHDVMPTTPAVPNPYLLPFAMRGFLDEDIVRNELANEVKKLLEQFDEWKPSTKALRDVKYRLYARPPPKFFGSS